MISSYSIVIESAQRREGWRALISRDAFSVNLNIDEAIELADEIKGRLLDGKRSDPVDGNDGWKLTIDGSERKLVIEKWDPIKSTESMELTRADADRLVRSLASFVTGSET